MQRINVVGTSGSGKVSTYGRRRRDYPQLLAAHPHLRVIRLRTPRHADRWLRSIGP